MTLRARVEVLLNAADALAATPKRPSRLDRFCLSPRMAEAVVDLRVIDARGSRDPDWPLLFLRRDLLMRALLRPSPQVSR